MKPPGTILIFVFGESAAYGDPQGLASLGAVCYLEGWTNQAVRNLAAALNLDPTDGNAHFYLGVVLFEQKKNSAASEQFQEAMRFNPQNTAAQEYLNRIQKNRPAGSQP